MAIEVGRLVESDIVVDLAQEICRIPSPLGGEKPLAVYITRRLRVMSGDTKRKAFRIGGP